VVVHDELSPFLHADKTVDAVGTLLLNAKNTVWLKDDCPLPPFLDKNPG
jgi:hypothetical protein